MKTTTTIRAGRWYWTAPLDSRVAPELVRTIRRPTDDPYRDGRGWVVRYAVGQGRVIMHETFIGAEATEVL